MAMRFEEYANKYRTVRMERRDGILQMTFHTDGGPLQWGLLPHEEFARAFRDVGSDRETRVVIMTGTGEYFSGPRPNPDDRLHLRPRDWDVLYWEGKQLLEALLDIEMPMISAVNGPVLRHTELPLLCDTISCWPAKTPCSRTPGTFVNTWCRATACTSSTRCCWA
jgi:enoyl-CoA hydratase/carnithine racemase